MRQVNLVGRGVLVVSLVMILAVPAAQARTNDEQGWSGREQIAKIVRIIKKVKGAIRTFGDGLIDPRP